MVDFFVASLAIEITNLDVNHVIMKDGLILMDGWMIYLFLKKEKKFVKNKRIIGPIRCASEICYDHVTC